MKNEIAHTQNQKLILQKKTVKKLNKANMVKIQGGAKKINNDGHTDNTTTR